MTKIFLLTLWLSFFGVQPDYQIKKTWLFSKTEYSGNVPRLPGGKQVSGIKKTLLFYIETGKDQSLPQWQTAYFNGSSYEVTTLESRQDSVAVGIDKNAKRPVVLKPATGDKIVQLKMTLTATQSVVENDGFVLSGMFKKSAVTMRTDRLPVELVPDMMP